MKHYGLIVVAITGVMLANLLFDLAIDRQRIQHQVQASRDLDHRRGAPTQIASNTGGEAYTLTGAARQRGSRKSESALQAGLKLAIVSLAMRDDARGGLARARRLFARPTGPIEAVSTNTAGAEDDVTANLQYLPSGMSSLNSLNRDFSEPRSVSNRGIEDSMRGPTKAGEPRAHLIEQIARLESNLNQSVEHGQRLEDEREFLNTRIAGLERRLAKMGEAQQAIVERLTDRIRDSVHSFEETVAMTGIDVDRILSAMKPEALWQDSGGPFIPGDYVLKEDSVYSLKSSIALLDLRMDRWEGLQTVVRSVPLSAPLDQFRISSRFGKRHDPVNGRAARHYGLDLAAPRRTPIRATAPGQVVFAGWKGHFGRVVEIDHGHGIRTRYAHLNKILVEPGQEIGHRDKIGLLGSSGRSTGPHVHYEVQIHDKLYDPMKFLKAGQNAFKN